MAKKHTKHTKHADKLYGIRSQKKLAEVKAGATDNDGNKYDFKVLDGDSSMVRHRAPAVEEGLKLIKAKTMTEAIDDKIKKRVRYAAMQARKEQAAAVLAVGGTRRMAARRAGISHRQIAKYVADPDFRERVAELQELLANKIRGRVMKEVGRRTNPKLIKKMELLDLLRVGDRVGLGRGKASAVNIHQEFNQHNYEEVFNAAFFGDNDQESDPDAEEEGADFPTFKPTRLALSGGDSPIEG
jgi:hypothetical protein